MPGGDRTGPLGMGPRTGRAAGYCGGYDTPGYANPFPRGGGFNRPRYYGGGGGRGHRHWFYATGLPGYVRAAQGIPAWGGAAGPGPYAPPPTVPGDELEILKSQAEYLNKALSDIKSRIDKLESEG
jgi:hypothetical protein